MNENARKSIKTYDARAASLCKTYNDLTTENVLPGILRILPVKYQKRPYRALDLGCGSGRDAFWLASQGFYVVGADASIGMIRQAWDQKMHGSKTIFIEDKFPSLDRVRQLNQSYDFYLMSASWMHLDGEERKTMVERMYGLSRSDATAYISLRHGPSPVDRPMFDTSVEELRDLASDNAAKSVVLASSADHQGRGNVTWDYVALQFLATKPHPTFG